MQSVAWCTVPTFSYIRISAATFYFWPLTKTFFDRYLWRRSLALIIIIYLIIKLRTSFIPGAVPDISSGVCEWSFVRRIEHLCWCKDTVKCMGGHLPAYWNGIRDWGGYKAGGRWMDEWRKCKYWYADGGGRCFFLQWPVLNSRAVLNLLRMPKGELQFAFMNSYTSGWWVRVGDVWTACARQNVCMCRKRGSHARKPVVNLFCIFTVNDIYIYMRFFYSSVPLD